MSWSGWRNILSIIGLLSMILLWVSDGFFNKKEMTDWKKLQPFQADLEFWSKRNVMRGVWEDHWTKKSLEVTQAVVLDTVLSEKEVVQKKKFQDPSFLPFRYVGRFHNESRNVIFVMLGKKSISLQEGDSLAGYKLEKITEYEAEFIYISSNNKVFLTFSKGSH